MDTRSLPALTAIAASDAAGMPPSSIKILPIGAIAARDGRRWQIADRAAAEAVLAATRTYHGETDAVVDYDHQTDIAVPKGGTAAAAGWIKGWELRDDGIWAAVEWTAKAAEALRERAYRYLSPVFQYDAGGRVTRILRASLVNSPALDLKALAAANPGDSMDLDAFLAGLRAPLGLPAAADATAVAAAVTALAARATTAETALAAVRTATGLGADADGTALAAAIVPAAQVAALQAKVTELETAARTRTEADATAAVDAAVAGGKIAPAAKDQYLAIAKANLPQFTALMNATPALLKPTSGTTTGAPGGGADLSDPVALAAAATRLVAEEKAKGIAITHAEAVVRLRPAQS